MERAFTEVKNTVPYSDFCNSLRVKGEQVPPEVGGNCIYQCVQLAAKLREAGYDPKFIQEIGGGHTALVCENNGKWYFFDPFLLHQEPICLDDVLFKDRAVRQVAAPYIHGNPTILAVRQDKRGKSFSTQIYLYVSAKKQYRPLWNRTFDFKNRSSTPPPTTLPPDELLALRPFRTYIRRFDPETKKVLALKMLFSSRLTGLTNASIGNEGEENVDSRWENEEFETKFDELATQLGITAQKLREVITRSEQSLYSNVTSTPPPNSTSHSKQSPGGYPHMKS